MPAAFILPDAMTRYMHTYWLKIDPTSMGANGSSNATLGIGVAYPTPANQILKLTLTIVSGVLTVVQLTVRGSGVTLTSQLSPLYNGSAHQLAVEYISFADDTQMMFNVYLDANLVYASAYTAKVAFPAGTVSVNSVACQGTYTRTFAGRFYRARMENLTLTTKTALAILVEDMSSVSGRLS
ncbi:hypothetical protein [Sodalis sp. C49]|uniref:hypothetical protein n=1 Tax=Sodalis sp. C49 TaxID=3228929 RepID=UPI00396591DB